MSDEFNLLKERAATLGISHSPNIGIDTLREKIENKLSEPENINAGSIEKTVGQKRLDAQATEMKLVRLRIANLNPLKKDLNGEIFTVANKIIGTVRKYIPYGEATDNGYHVPYIIYKQLKERKFHQVKVTQHKDGNTSVDSKWIPEFALEILPQLTPEELSKLASQQTASSIG